MATNPFLEDHRAVWSGRVRAHGSLSRAALGAGRGEEAGWNLHDSPGGNDDVALVACVPHSPGDSKSGRG